MTVCQALDEEHERCLGGLELISLIFEILNPVKHTSEQLAVLLQTVFTEFLGDV